MLKKRGILLVCYPTWRFCTIWGQYEFNTKFEDWFLHTFCTTRVPRIYKVHLHGISCFACQEKDPEWNIWVFILNFHDFSRGFQWCYPFSHQKCWNFLCFLNSLYASFDDLIRSTSPLEEAQRRSLGGVINSVISCVSIVVVCIFVYLLMFFSYAI